MRVALVLATGIAVVMLAGVAHGILTERWQSFGDLEDAARLLGHVGTKLGSWEGEPVVLDPKEIRLAGAFHYVMRRYSRGGERTGVSILLMCGRSGPMMVHTPEICYQGTGFELDGPSSFHKLTYGPLSETAEFCMTQFTKRDIARPRSLKVFWSCKAPGASWAAPNNQRIAIGQLPVLYKLYVICEVTTPDEQTESESRLELVKCFLADLERSSSSAAKPQNQ